MAAGLGKCPRLRWLPPLDDGADFAEGHEPEGLFIALVIVVVLAVIVMPVVAMHLPG